MKKLLSVVYLTIVSLPLLLLLQCAATPPPPPKKDTLKIMSYNVLKYGSGCQGPAGKLHQYLGTIVGYLKPDILGLVKVEAIPQPGNTKGKASVGFADSILVNALNKGGRKYAYCPFTNAARDNNQNILFYNRGKLGYSGYETVVSDGTDINMYKLYYMDPELPKTHDTVFLYIVLVHTDSGDKPDDRDRQMTELMAALRKRFTALPNMVVMGDFNLRKTNETGYQVLTNNAEEKFRFVDPPFSIDKKAELPANWDKHPERCAAYLTTSTRKKEDEPNDCGTGGGAKGWYDHIFLSPVIAEKSGSRYGYIPGSYHTVGNDGKRIDRSVNDMPNSAAPKDVLDALYQMSNKYPVMLELGVYTTK